VAIGLTPKLDTLLKAALCKRVPCRGVTGSPHEPPAWCLHHAAARRRRCSSWRRPCRPERRRRLPAEATGDGHGRTGPSPAMHRRRRAPTPLPVLVRRGATVHIGSGAQIPRSSPTSAAISVRRWAFGFALTRKLAPCRAGMAGAEASRRRPPAVASYRAAIDVLALARPGGGSRLLLSAAPVTTGSAAFERISSSCFVAAASSC
jgi:hypothetical protein